jgi:hypothetical protein
MCEDGLVVNPSVYQFHCSRQHDRAVSRHGPYAFTAPSAAVKPSAEPDDPYAELPMRRDAGRAKPLRPEDY